MTTLGLNDTSMLNETPAAQDCVLGMWYRGVGRRPAPAGAARNDNIRTNKNGGPEAAVLRYLLSF